MSSAPSAAGVLRRLVHEPRDSLRTAVSLVRDEPALLTTRLLGALPVAVRRPLARLWALLGRVAARILPRAGWPLVLLLVARDALGERVAAVELALERAAGLRPRGRLMVAGWLAEVDRADAALELVAERTGSPAVRGRVLWRAGAWQAARDELEAAARSGPSGTRRLLHRVEQDLTAVTDGWLPTVGPLPVQAPIPGRAVHLINNSLPQVQAGYTVRAQRVALAQRAEGIDPVMVTKLGYPWRQGLPTEGERAQVDGVQYVHVPDPGGDAIFGTAERVERAVARTGPVIAGLRPAVLHPTTPYDNAQLALALGEALAIPVVYELRGFLEETWLSRTATPAAAAAALASDRYRLTRATEGWCARRADHVITLGEAMKADLVTRGVPPDRVTVVPNAVDLDAFTASPGRARGHQLRRDLAIPSERLVLGYISSLVPYEGVEVLLRAARLLLDRGRDIEVLVVGDGTARSGWEQQARALGLGARCRFTGRVPHAEVQAYYEAIDVFVVPRRDDRVCRLVTPLKPVEAMALEGCVVVSDLPALAEMVEDGVTGRLFPPEDPEALAEVVEELAEAPELRLAYGRAGRAAVAERRTWVANGQRYREVYAALGVL